jgi:hypothetical protein
MRMLVAATPLRVKEPALAQIPRASRVRCALVSSQLGFFTSSDSPDVLRLSGHTIEQHVHASSRIRLFRLADYNGSLEEPCCLPEQTCHSLSAPCAVVWLH